jgi:hypothetical protein
MMEQICLREGRNSMRQTRIGLLVLALLAAVGLTTTTAMAGSGSQERMYRVTLLNLTGGQPFSPPVAATHRRGEHMFQVGGLASDELAAIAQGGMQGPMFEVFDGANGVTDAVDVARPLTPRGITRDTITSWVSFEITARNGDRLSLATMLICTNDGFLGLDSVRLPGHGTAVYLVNGYDAGREENTELSEHIVDPCSALGPVALADDPDGNLESGTGVSTEPPVDIAMHPGILGVGELSVDGHDWINPVARVVVQRIA